MTESQAQKILSLYLELRDKLLHDQNKELIFQYHQQEQHCYLKFKYLIRHKTFRYRRFGNYQDLQQEGAYAIIKALRSYDPNKGSWFGWVQQHLKTRIVRSANQHSIIRLPLTKARQIDQHQDKFPLMVYDISPDQQIDSSQTNQELYDVLETCFSDSEQQVIKLYHGLETPLPVSISRISKQLKMPKKSVSQIINNSLQTFKENLDL